MDSFTRGVSVKQGHAHASPGENGGEGSDDSTTAVFKRGKQTKKSSHIQNSICKPCMYIHTVAFFLMTFPDDPRERDDEVYGISETKGIRGEIVGKSSASSAKSTGRIVRYFNRRMARVESERIR